MVVVETILTARAVPGGGEKAAFARLQQQEARVAVRLSVASTHGVIVVRAGGRAGPFHDCRSNRRSLVTLEG